MAGNWRPGSRQSRGYGAEWDRVRLLVLERDHYLCQCSDCASAGRVTPANQVDHITPKSKGGGDDMQNLQAINAECHKRKTVKDRGDKPRRRIGLDGWPIIES